MAWDFSSGKDAQGNEVKLDANGNPLPGYIDTKGTWSNTYSPTSSQVIGYDAEGYPQFAPMSGLGFGPSDYLGSHGLASTPGGLAQDFIDWVSPDFAKNAVNRVTGGGRSEAAPAAAPTPTVYPEPPASTPAAGGSGQTVGKGGELTDPGTNEKFFTDTESFYKSPTEAHTKWDTMKGQPTEQEQLWNKYSGIYQNPGTEQGELYGNWESLFSNPNYLDDYYQREAAKAQTTLDRKAASGGWGDSGAAARATANVGRDFADRALLAKGQWAQTGMGLAGAADTSVNTKAATGMGLAGAADKSQLERLSAAEGVDTGDLARISAGQVAAGAAQRSKEARLGGALSSQQGIADDMASLSGVFYSQAEAEKFATDMAAIQVQYKQGDLSLTDAINKSQEALVGLNVMSQTALNTYVMNKLLSKDEGYTPDVARGNDLTIGGG